MKYKNLVRYMANKAGGVHYDRSRKKNFENQIDEMRSIFEFSAPENFSRETRKVNIEVFGGLTERFDFLQLEIISIAQSLCNVRYDGERFMPLKRIEEDKFGIGDDIFLGHTHHFIHELRDV